jgi:alanyl-tRNA synthetase
MSTIQRVKALAAAFAVLFLMNSCTEFFSTSWGEGFKRDPENVKVTSSNVYDLLDAAKGDPKLSRAILNKINAGSNPTLKRAAIRAANQAAEISTVALKNIKGLINAVDGSNPEKALKEVANNIRGGLKSNDIVGIADKMAEILVVLPSALSPSEALKNAESITVPVSKSNGGKGTMTIVVDADGTGTATIDNLVPCNNKYFTQ